jgi:hypothetical protein
MSCTTPRKLYLITVTIILDSFILQIRTLGCKWFKVKEVVDKKGSATKVGFRAEAHNHATSLSLS